MILAFFVQACVLMGAGAREELMDCTQDGNASVGAVVHSDGVDGVSASLRSMALDNEPVVVYVHGKREESVLRVTVFIPDYRRGGENYEALHKMLPNEEDAKTTNGVVDKIESLASERIEMGQFFYSDLLDRSITDAVFGVNSTVLRRCWAFWPSTKTTFSECRYGDIRIAACDASSVGVARFFLEGTCSPRICENSTLEGYRLLGSKEELCHYSITGKIWVRSWFRGRSW